MNIAPLHRVTVADDHRLQHIAQAIRVRTRVSPSIRSVFARRRRREVRIEAASTTWLSIPSDCSTRWIQK
jgi:hypothetical protein